MRNGGDEDDGTAHKDECEHDVVVVEEEWSAFVARDDDDDDDDVVWSSGFASHNDLVVLPLSDGASRVALRSTRSLTPLDMMGLHDGTFDATGSRVWTGARLFVAAFAARAIDDESSSCNLLDVLRRRTVSRKRVLELGCGTGCAGLSLLLQANVEDRPSFVTLTDADDAALALCRRNRDLNRAPSSACAVRRLAWYDADDDDDDGSLFEPGSYDTTIAADVLYDVDALGPLTRTASRLTKPGGYFVLSHVPRADVSSRRSDDDDDSVGTVLRRLILEHARRAGFLVADDNKDKKEAVVIVEPRHLRRVRDGDEHALASNDDEPPYPYDDMQDAGASIFVFRKTS